MIQTLINEIRKHWSQISLHDQQIVDLIGQELDADDAEDETVFHNWQNQSEAELKRILVNSRRPR